MGYTTSFYGSFEIDRVLDDELFDYLTLFSHTRRMKRDSSKLKKLFGEEFGVEGEFFVRGEGHFGQDRDETIIDYNQPPRTQPGLWCKWIPSKDKKRIVWTGAEKFYDADDWIIYLIENFLKPNGYQLNGIVAAKGEDSEDFWMIRIEDNEVFVNRGWDNIVLKNGKNEHVPYCLKLGDNFLVRVNDFSFSSEESSLPSWSDLSKDDYFKMMTFESKEEAEEYYGKIRIKSIFEAPSKEAVQVEPLTEHFVLLNEYAVVELRENNPDYIQPNFGIITESPYDFERYSVQKLFIE